MIYNSDCGGRGTPKQLCYSQRQTTVLLCSVSRSVGFAADYDCSGSSTTTQQGGFLLETPNMKGQLVTSQGVGKHDTPTMTSIELVEFINEQRAPDEAQLRHRDFCEKVKKVLGEGVCENFRIPYEHPQNGQTYSIFNFPKREACLMAMSYSYDLQAKVFDRMTELEQKQPAPLTDAERLLITAQSLVALERGQQQLEKRIEQIETGAIPPGWQTISNLALECGLTPDKTRQFIRNFDVPNKKIPFLAPTGILTNATVADEQAFRAAFAEMKRTASRPLRGVMWSHPKLGKFQMREVQP